MTISIWEGNKARIDTRKVGKERFDAVIYPDGNTDSNKSTDFLMALEQAGYEVRPMPIPQAPEHSLTISGFRDAADRRQVLDSIQRYVEVLKLHISDLPDGSLQITGFKHQGQVEELWRMVKGPWYEPRKDIKVKHTAEEQPAKMGIAVHGIPDEKALFSLAEKTGWCQGERRDEYYGMSPFKARWNKIMKDASKYASALYMVGEGLVLASISIDATRRKISPLQHEGILEPIGYLSGSAGMFTGSLLRQPPTTDQVLSRFEKNFQVANDHDYEGKSDQFKSDGRDMGRASSTIKHFFRDNGTEFIMLMNTLAGYGVWNGRYRHIFDMPSADNKGQRDMNLNADGSPSRTEKLSFKNALSGAMLVPGTLMYAFLNKKGRENLFVKYEPMLESMLEVPVLGALLRMVGRASDTTAGNILLYVPRKIADWLSDNPTNYAARMFQTHNVGQLAFGTVETINVRKEADLLSAQFDNEAAQLRNGVLSIPSSDYFAKNPKISSSEQLRNVLLAICDKDDSHTYKRVIEEFLNPETGKARPEMLEKPEEVLKFTKAMNRQYYEELRKEIGSFGWKLAGNTVNFAAGMALAHTGDAHKGLVNVAETVVNPFVICDGIVEKLRADGALTEKAISNAASWLFQDDAMRPFGFGVDDYKEILTAKSEGRPSVKEVSFWNKGGWVQTQTPAPSAGEAEVSVTEIDPMLSQETRTDRPNPAWNVTPKNQGGYAGGLESGAISPEKVHLTDGAVLTPQ